MKNDNDNLTFSEFSMTSNSPGGEDSPADVKDKTSQVVCDVIGKKSVKYKFTAEEDEKLKMLVLSHGTSSWGFIAQLMGTRNHRQCRERWKNYINPALRNDPWTLEEDQLLVDKYAEFGPKWNKIAKFFAHRSDNAIRNRWQLMIRQWERQKHMQLSSQDVEAPASEQGGEPANDGV